MDSFLELCKIKSKRKSQKSKLKRKMQIEFLRCQIEDNIDSQGWQEDFVAGGGHPISIRYEVRERARGKAVGGFLSYGK